MHSSLITHHASHHSSVSMSMSMSVDVGVNGAHFSMCRNVYRIVALLPYGLTRTASKNTLLFLKLCLKLFLTMNAGCSGNISPHQPCFYPFAPTLTPTNPFAPFL